MTPSPAEPKAEIRVRWFPKDVHPPSFLSGAFYGGVAVALAFFLLGLAFMFGEEKGRVEESNKRAALEGASHE